MIFNIIDRRKKPYSWKQITAVIEPIWQDNYVSLKNNGDYYNCSAEMEQKAGIGYEEIEQCSLAMAIEKASSLEYPCTLFLYDLGANRMRVIKPNHLEDRETAEWVSNWDNSTGSILNH